MKPVIIGTILVMFAAPAAYAGDTYQDYMTDAWSTIMDNNETGKWKQSISAEGVEISTIQHASCVDDASICVLNQRIYPSGDTVLEYIPLNS